MEHARFHLNVGDFKVTLAKNNVNFVKFINLVVNNAKCSLLQVNTTYFIYCKNKW